MGSGIEITLFDKFEIRKDGEQILAGISNTRKTKLFLSYLLLNKQKAIPHKELFELLWSGEDYSNPGTALRTLLYRYRALVDKAGITQLSNSIISRRGAYQWNQDLDISIDIFDFEEYAGIGLNSAISILKRKECLKQAIRLYRGNLLNDSSSEHWVVPKFVYYRDLYLKVIEEYIGILKSEEKYGEIMDICEETREIIGYNEFLNMEFMYARRLRFGRDDDDFSPSRYEKLISLYKEMDTSVDEAQKNMESNDEENSAYVCDYSSFRDIYHLQRRLLARTGETMFLCLLTMATENEQEYDPIANEKLMSSLLSCCRHALRCGDSICRYSDSCLAIMFPADSYLNAEKIMERVKNGAYASIRETGLILSYRIRPLKNAKE